MENLEYGTSPVETQRSTEQLKEELDRKLPEYATELIEGDWYRQGNEDPYRAEFAKEPDNVLMHESSWHQWGIVTHSKYVGQAFEKDIPDLFNQWYGQEDSANKFGLADELIGDKSKWDLLILSSPLHDLGKFSERTYKGLKSDGKTPDFSFKKHEQRSGEIVRTWNDRFKDMGISDSQIEYLARCAELHFELGKIRDVAKKSPSGYTIKFVNSDQFKAAALEIARQAPGMAREVGAFFLADSLGKTDLRQAINASTDQEIAVHKAEIDQMISERNLSSVLNKVALQLPVNMRAGQRYMELVRSEL